MASWSPDGSRIVFQSSQKGTGGFDLYIKSADGAQNEELLLTSPQTEVVNDWSADRRFLLYRSLDPKSNYDLWVLPMDGIDKQSFPLVQTNFAERDVQFSPDGKWIAYQSDESGRFEIFAQPFPGPGGRIQISTNGSAQVRWPSDGRELFYIGLDDRLMAVPIAFNANGRTLEPGKPVPLFTTHVGGAVQVPGRQQYVVSADGQRFLMDTIVAQTVSPITVILNWRPKLHLINPLTY